MSLAGVASRRKSEELIRMGEVKVNGDIVTAPSRNVSPDDIVTVSGKSLRSPSKLYIMLNKPAGYLCSAFDPHADKTVFDLINLRGVRLFSAGRLDLNSEGLLILTNDGDYAEKLTHPRHNVLKRYRVKTDKPISNNNLNALRSGIRDFGEFLKPVSISKLKAKEYEFVLNEGKKREIRRLVATTGVKVVVLKRVAVGNLRVDDLPVGQWRMLSKKEIAASLSTADASKRQPRSGGQNGRKSIRRKPAMPDRDKINESNPPPRN